MRELLTSQPVLRDSERVKNIREGGREGRDSSGGREDEDGSVERVHD